MGAAAFVMAELLGISYFQVVTHAILPAIISYIALFYIYYGSSLIFGHPQGPTGMRLVIELVEELALNGGGYGLFTGCAAGDTGAALVVKVG